MVMHNSNTKSLLVMRNNNTKSLPLSPLVGETKLHMEHSESNKSV